eukprot:gnl/TRDRNA2_/TRDRNA2_172196_c0_seq12.p1 gnl/TRDRNA2_/TRDRNA2_172196_c0~~gnl/TRDRNA2_/TRDRNA2_172196_c0_seq12.p1  ORF type:complete len:604 (+),score=49.55 gnl/TRDRNA2_/TRDRNA2_172196_c0_seq12:73-1884(+)
MIPYKLLSVFASLPVASSHNIGVDWSAPPLQFTEGVPTYLNQVNPSMDRECPIHDAVFKRMCTLGTKMVRYLHWGAPPPGAPFPEMTEGVFNFTHTDEYVLDFMQCPNAEDSVINFDMWGGPKWLHWNNSNDYALRDPTGVEFGEWISRIVSWYTKGGFTDSRTGRVYKSGHYFKWKHYEVLNEPDLRPYMNLMVNESNPSGPKLPAYAAYTRIYDGIAGVLRRDHPELKLHALSLASIKDDWLSYFFDKANHAPGAPIPDYVTYHFYSVPSTPLLANETGIGNWPWETFTQAAQFIGTAAQAYHSIRKGTFGGDSVKISVNEVGVIAGGFCPIRTLFNNSKLFWNLKAAVWAYYYGELLRVGASSVAFSQITGYPGNTWKIRGKDVNDNYPCVSMLDWHDGSGTAVYWAVKMFADVLGNGNKSVFATNSSFNISVATTTPPPMPKVKCQAPFPYLSSSGDLCYNNADDAKHTAGPCGSWCAAFHGAGAGCGDGHLCPWVPPPGPPDPIQPKWPLPSVVYSIGFKLHARGVRALLLANTNSSEASVNVWGVMGSKMHVVDTEAGHGPVPYATKVLGSNEVQLGPLAVAIIEIAEDEHPATQFI